MLTFRKNFAYITGKENRKICRCHYLSGHFFFFFLSEVSLDCFILCFKLACLCNPIDFTFNSDLNEKKNIQKIRDYTDNKE